jgi:hypothetical protein
MTRQVEFTPESEAALNYERYRHPVPLVQRRRAALWLKRQGSPHGQSAPLVGIPANTPRAYFQLYLEGGVEGRKAGAIQGPGSALQAHDPAVKSPGSCKVVRQQTRHFCGIAVRVLILAYSLPVCPA